MTGKTSSLEGEEAEAPALADVGRIVRYIAKDNPPAAQGVARALMVAGHGLAELPLRGRVALVGGR